MNTIVKISFILLVLFFVFIFIVVHSETYKVYTTEEIRGDLPYTKIHSEWNWENFRSYLEKLYEDLKLYLLGP